MLSTTTNTDASACKAYGSLIEGVHIGGYTIERVFTQLKWLLDEDRWQRLGVGFSDVNEFLRSIKLDNLRILADQRKDIATKIKKQQPQASNRAIAEMLKVDEKSIRNDLAEASAVAPEKPKETTAPVVGNAELSAPSMSGAAAAKLVERRETAKEDRLARVAADEARVLALTPRPGKFRTIVIDPAWEYDWLSLAGRAKPGYAMQTLDQLRDLDVAAWADDEGCHLYCWTTNNFFAEACKLVAHWGFQHRTKITWIKPPPFGLGSYFRNSTEDVLFATRGETTTRHAAASIPTHFEAPRGEHSEKPERFYEIVRAASYPPYGEANQRTPRPDFLDLFGSATVVAAQ
jgi:N6-adenosine-specific RNA methylase IME4